MSSLGGLFSTPPLVLVIASAADSLATAIGVRVQAFMKRQHTHADGTLLLRGQFPERPNILFGAEIELASSFIKHLLDPLALLLMLLVVTVLAILVAIPNTLAPITLLESIALRFARRALVFGRGGRPIIRGGILPLR